MGPQQRAIFVLLESQKERRKTVGLKKYFEEIITENFASLVKDINLQLKEQG